MNRFAVEICIDAGEDRGMQAATAAAWRGGADRIELCRAMHLDGLTPDEEHVRIARDAFPGRPGLLAMIRPRDGDFAFSAAEIALMEAQIGIAADCGADGVVLGVLRAGDSRIAVSPLRDLTAAARARGLAVTVHRCFDATPDPDEALDTLIDLAVDRVLTSGLPWGRPGNAVDGLPRLLRTIQRAAGRIEVVIGGGVNPDNAATLVAALPAGARVSLHAYSGVQRAGVTSEEAVRALVKVAGQQSQDIDR